MTATIIEPAATGAEEVATTGTDKEQRSFTHTLLVQAKTVVTILGESMRRYLLPRSSNPQ